MVTRHPVVGSGRRTILAGIAAAMVALPLTARSQRRDEMRRLGILMAGGGRGAEGTVADLVKDLDVLGWHEGGNLYVEVRYARGDRARYDSYAAELVALRPDLLVAQATPSTAALQRQTTTIPIVFVLVSDPVGQGFVKNLARPGGNITGFADSDPPMASKLLDMLMQVTPRVIRVAALYNPATAPLVSETMRTLEAAARQLGVVVRAAPYHAVPEIEAIMAELAREEGGGVLVVADFSATLYRREIVDVIAHHRLPAVYGGRSQTEVGGLMSYTPRGDDLFRQAAAYVDRILKGASPGDLPVQYPTKFELVINLKTATALGITIAPSLLAAADAVIE
jgi:putative ABC transport system substrate-binding protein